MDDLISRQAAIDILDAFQVKVETGEDFAYSWARMRMTELPSVQERKGRWIKHNDYLGWAYLCSECNHFLTIKYNYCPNCGAKMEGVEDAGRNE